MPDRAHPADASPLLEDRTWPTVGTPLLLVPVGSTEQHGPHLPLGTDSRIAEAVTSGLASRLATGGVAALTAPTIAYGSSGEHQAFSGTVSIGTSALSLLLVELGRSASSWARRIVFVNAHGGNVEALTQAVPTLRREARNVAWLPCAAVFTAGDSHAGWSETALLQRLHPELVRTDRLEAGVTAPIAEILPRLRREGVREVSPNGVLGDPRGADAAAGERALRDLVDAAWARLGGRVEESTGRLAAAEATQ